MKKFIIALSVLVLLFMALDAAHYRLGWYIDLMPEEPVTTFVKTDGKEIYLDCGEGWQPFEIRGVNIGLRDTGQVGNGVCHRRRDLSAVVRVHPGNGGQYRSGLYHPK